jgi:hypothetical protein
MDVSVRSLPYLPCLVSVQPVYLSRFSNTETRRDSSLQVEERRVQLVVLILQQALNNSISLRNLVLNE